MYSFRNLFKHILILIFICSIQNTIISQDCDGAEILTQESYLYGRFEVSMKSAEGDGIISSFFLFNNSSGCNYPEENNEIDVEMTGNNNKIYFTSHHPGNPNPWFYGDNFDLGFSPHEELHEYAIEWEPGIIRWFVDGELIYVQDEPEAEELMYPMAIYMNIWATGAVDWAGEWNSSIMPQTSLYDWVKYFSYAPGEGNYGTGNNFVLAWEDDFESLDESRWTTSDFTSFDLNYCSYKSGNVLVNNGYLHLTIDEPTTNLPAVPVRFSVNTSDIDLNENDKVYLNGTFNDWCGTCNPMVQNGEQWELTLDIIPGKYEYLFTINGWDITGTVPLNSECDFTPCDEFQNYGFILKEGSEGLVLDSYCWASCDICLISGNQNILYTIDKELLKIVDITGRESLPIPNHLLFYIYKDGSVEKRFIVQY